MCVRRHNIRYHELLFIVDTCQANTLYTRFYSPNILAAGSSSKGQNSYSHSDASPQLGVAVIDRYTYYMLDFMERSVLSVQSQSTLADLVIIY
jgi:glycosylphosphatidylinositol transamidase (GPIT) subunit GPI8